MQVSEQSKVSNLRRRVSRVFPRSVAAGRDRRVPCLRRGRRRHEGWTDAGLEYIGVRIAEVGCQSERLPPLVALREHAMGVCSAVIESVENRTTGTEYIYYKYSVYFVVDLRYSRPAIGRLYCSPSLTRLIFIADPYSGSQANCAKEYGRLNQGDGYGG